MKELKVGERVTITLEVVEKDDYYCEDCFFNAYKECPGIEQGLLCYSSDRSDHKNVIFKEVK